jgi:RNA polymerase sigma-70 factor (ECF subfamily)
LVQIENRRSTSIFNALLADAREGSETAWATIYHDLVGPVTGYLARLGVTEPDDVAAEVFLQVARDIHNFTGNEQAFRSWVFVIAHRRMIDWRRSTARRPVVPHGNLPERSGGNVEDEAIEVLATGHVDDVLDALTPEQREVLTLRVIADLSLEGTAAVMGKTVGAVKALQRRAIKTVRTELQQGRVSL